MRPIASTAVASMQNIAAPDSASMLMWVKCQSLASPFSAEYWHIGATMMRLGKLKAAQADRGKQGAHGESEVGGISRPCLAGWSAWLNWPATAVFTLADLKR